MVTSRLLYCVYLLVTLKAIATVDASLQAQRGTTDRLFIAMWLSLEGELGLCP